MPKKTKAQQPQKPQRPSQKQQLEQDVARIVELLRHTQEQLKVDHPFFDDAALIVEHARSANPAAGIMALHMVSVATAELLSKRGCAAKICLVTALALVEERMHNILIDLFQQAFVPNRPDNAPTLPPGIEHVIQALIENQGVLVEQQPNGKCKIKVGDQVFDAVKIPLGAVQAPKGKKKAGKPQPPPDPRLN